MPIINNLFLSFGERVLFNNINASIGYDEKIGFLGRNGSGKSTLLKVIAGEQTVDSGSVVYNKNKTIGYLPQEVVLESKKSVFDEAIDVFSVFINLQKEVQEIENKLTAGVDAEVAHELTDRYSIILEKLLHFDQNKVQVKTERILQGLGFSVQQLQQTVDTLSVGWKMRLCLAKLLLQEADFYLFDEPTNHLDLPTKEWFFTFLKEANFGYLLVTHDKYFLERACEKIVEIERGNITIYKGGFSSYLTQKEKRNAELLAAYKQQQKEVARKKETINRFRAKSTKAAMVQSMIRDLDNMERIEIESTMPTVHFSFGEVVRAGKIVLELDKVSHAFGDNLLFKNASCQVARGKKVALIAPNGTGKTTLFNLITGTLPLQHGSIEFGHNVKAAYFEQDQARVMNKDNTVFQEVVQGCPKVTEARIRSFLGSFLFSGDDVQKKIHQLSGGEKNRVAMVKVLLQNANVLLLDEPTNHLDIYAKEVLQQALQQYHGTIIFVSHDHDFVQHVADAILELTPDGLYVYDGDYESYLYHKKVTEQAQQEKEVSKSEQQKKKQSKDENQNYQLKKQLRSVESKIKKLEAHREKRAHQFADLAYGTPKYNELLAQLATIDAELAQLHAQWEDVMHQLM